jgi:hypothetical protein
MKDLAVFYPLLINLLTAIGAGVVGLAILLMCASYAAMIWDSFRRERSE